MAGALMDSEGLRFEHYCEICYSTEEVTGLTVPQWELVSELTRKAHEHTRAEKFEHRLDSIRADHVGHRENRDDEAAPL